MGDGNVPSFAGTRTDDVDFSNARLHAPNFEGAKITDGWFYGADISGDLEGLRLNGVEVGPLVTAELERIFPERAKLRATDPEEFADAWAMLEDRWEATAVRAAALPDNLLHKRVDDEWSFVETLRHLVSATDCWLRRMVKGIERPYHPWGLAGSWLTDPVSWGLDPAATPSLDDVLALRRERMDEVRQAVAALTPEELDRTCIPPESPGHPNQPHTVRECLRVILNEEWEHNRYAVRDLESLERANSSTKAEGVSLWLSGERGRMLTSRAAHRRRLG